MLMDKVTEAAIEYFRTKSTLRFGQYYIINHMPEDTVWPELFYERNTAIAGEMIRDRQYKESAQ